jgi:formylglycine-generating enzyme required for sulfatase activity
MIKSQTLMPFVAGLFAAFLSMSNLQAQPLVTIDTVAVGDPGNAADTTGYGAVADVFAIGKYEVTIGQYTSFLNAAAATDTYSLYNPSMGSNLNVAGISRVGSDGSYTYSVISNSFGYSGNRPITYVSWFDGARFANWMNNGATNGASTETGAYTLDGAMSGIITVNPGATWSLPSEDQWYKAAYYKGGGTNAGYWDFPTQSDTTPGNVVGGVSNQANFTNNLGEFSVTQSTNYSPSQNYLTEVGAFSSSAGFYGTFDQGGNVMEWNDAVVDTNQRGVRGGAYDYGSDHLQSDFAGGVSLNPVQEFDDVGFRVATVPEPSTYALLLLAGAGWLLCQRRKVKL